MVQNRPTGSPQPTPPSALPYPNNLYLSDTTVLDSESEQQSSDAAERLYWHGCFVFSMESRPRYPHLGWTLGRGPYRLDEKVDWSRYADVVPTLGVRSKSLKIQKTSVALNFTTRDNVPSFGVSNPKSGYISINGKKVHKERGLVPVQHDAILRVGDLEFLCCWTVGEGEEEQRQFQDNHENYLKRALHRQDRLAIPMSTPSSRDYSVNGWRLLEPLGKGAFGVVVAALHRNGASGAAKSVEDEKFDSAVENMKRLKQELSWQSARKYVLQFEDSLRGPAGHNYIISTPVAIGTLNFFIDRDTDKILSCAYSVAIQLLQAVDALHRIKYLHGDIKPLNIGLVSMHPEVHIVLLDVDSGEFVDNHEHELMHNKQGRGRVIPFTHGFAAPERELVDRPWFGLPSDLWSVGCTFLELFKRFKSIGESRDKDSLEHTKKLQSWLRKQYPNDSIENLIYHLLGEFPHDRLTAEGALRHRALARYTEAAAAISEIEQAQPGAKRSATGGELTEAAGPSKRTEAGPSRRPRQ